MRYIILFSYLWVTFLQAESIYITDKKDNQILVENPSIYYTSKKGSSLSLFYRPDVEKNGIRIKQGMGMIVIPWKKIGILHINDIYDNNISAILENKNNSIPLSLLKPHDGLEGESDLGTFLINFRDIKKISNTANTVPKDAHIIWDENLSVTLDSTGLTSSEGIQVFGSFDLKSEDFRTISFLSNEIKFPKHNILLARKDYTVYILDLKKQKKIGQFKIPSRGTPRMLEIQRDNYNFTKLETKFRILSKREKGKSTRAKRPGPLITQIMVYRDGQYIHQKRKTD